MNKPFLIFTMFSVPYQTSISQNMYSISMKNLELISDIKCAQQSFDFLDILVRARAPFIMLR